MARPKKDGKTVSLIMEKELFDRLEAYCDETYLTKTAAIEKALKQLLDKYEEHKTKE
jgi:metal-responsive CopG/Arc/MetJ family transcriptional regulator